MNFFDELGESSVRQACMPGRAQLRRRPWASCFFILKLSGAFLAAFGLSLGWASVGVDEKPLYFKEWKQTLMTQAKSKVINISKEINNLKRSSASPKKNQPSPSEDSALSSKGSSSSGEELGGTALPHTDRLLELEDELRNAQENVRYYSQLSMSDYVEIHLRRWRDAPATLKQLIGKMPRADLNAALHSLLEKDENHPKSSPASVIDSAIGTPSMSGASSGGTEPKP